MRTLRRRARIWIVLADGDGARILLHRSWEPGRFRELARDTPGEAPDSRFETRVAALVSDAAAQGLFDALVLVAPSHTLGTLRRALGPAAGARLIREEARDLLALPEPALPARLAALLRR